MDRMAVDPVSDLSFNSFMHLETLKVFCDLTETKSCTQTAKINSVTQSAISQSISNLERQMQSLLIERSQRNLRLTAEGQVVYDFSKQMLLSYDSLRCKMQELQGEVAGQIQVATIYSIGLHDLPPYIKRFLKEHPSVNVKVQYRAAGEVYEEVLGNVADLGLVAFPQKRPNLEIVPFRTDRLILASHPRHRLAQKKIIKLKALNGERMVGFDPDVPTRKAIDGMLKHQSVHVEFAAQFDNIETVKRAVEIGLGVAILPEETIVSEVAQGSLTMVRLEGDYFRPLAIIWKRTKVLSPAVRTFMQFLKKPL